MNTFFAAKASNIVASLFAFVVGEFLLPVSPAMAIPITYDYTATAHAGPLSGDTFAGTFIVDSASVASGQGNVSSLTLNVLGTAITQSEGVFGLVPRATFRADGRLINLSNFVIISPARATAEFTKGGVFLPSPITSFNFDGAFNYGIDQNAGENIGGGTFAGRAKVRPGSPISEPASFLILGTFLVGLGMICNRRTNGSGEILSWLLEPARYGRDDIGQRPQR